METKEETRYRTISDVYVVGMEWYCLNSACRAILGHVVRRARDNKRALARNGDIILGEAEIICALCGTIRPWEYRRTRFVSRKW